MAVGKKIELEKLISIIRKNGLVHASSRKLPLIAVSCIFFGYNALLKKAVSYSYGTMAAFSQQDQSHFLFNEDRVGKEFNRHVSFSFLPKINLKLKKEFVKNKSRLIKEKNNKNPFTAMAAILEIYPKVLCQISFYNSIMRYVKNDRNKVRKLGKLVNSIAKDKDEMANLIYPEIEPLIIKNCQSLGRLFGFDGDLLRYLTLKEFKIFIKTKKIGKNTLVKLGKRKEQYFYLSHKSEDIIITDKKQIKDFKKIFLKYNSKTDIIKGVNAYPGKVRGVVNLVFHGLKKIKPGQILVTNITRPQDTPLLKKFSAIITDEGGVLSHIAVAARELKIPSIMNTKNASQILKNGDLVEVDASRGIIKLIKKRLRKR
jgi:phosphoenolpyruvate synthase/pyruvate phosphate dikinase